VQHFANLGVYLKAKGLQMTLSLPHEFSSSLLAISKVAALNL
jgi:hypothetical protein